jgi:iron complex transport system substrate-binding protein
VERCEGYTVVSVINPWDTTKLLQRYLLVNRNAPLPENMPKGTVVRTPLSRVAVYTSVHASMLEELGVADSIIGVCEPEYMLLGTIKERVLDGRIADLGASTSPNIERMMQTQVATIIASPFQNAGYGQAEKLGVPIIEAADYMETFPLGRAEWLRFFGLLFEKEVEADSLFSATESRYLALRDTATRFANDNGRPTVLSERRYGSFWYVPPRDSYIAHFLRDAGAENIFDSIQGVASVPLAFESVLNRAVHADVWMMKYNMNRPMTYADLRAEYHPYEEFDAFARRRIYACNTGNALYYEESPIHPDYLLADFISIFHPSALPGHKNRYFFPMQD